MEGFQYTGFKPAAGLGQVLMTPSWYRTLAYSFLTSDSDVLAGKASSRLLYRPHVVWMYCENALEELFRPHVHDIPVIFELAGEEPAENHFL